MVQYITSLHHRYCCLPYATFHNTCVVVMWSQSCISLGWTVSACTICIFNTSYQKLPFGSGDDQDKLVLQVYVYYKSTSQVNEYSLKERFEMKYSWCRQTYTRYHTWCVCSSYCCLSVTTCVPVTTVKYITTSPLLLSTSCNISWLPASWLHDHIVCISLGWIVSACIMCAANLRVLVERAVWD